MATRIGDYDVDVSPAGSLGEGGQINGPGEGVFRGQHIRTQQLVAVKRFNFRRAIGQGNHADVTSKYTRLKREVENAWKVSGHPHIVTLIDVAFDGANEFLHLVMELGDGKDLFNHVSSNGTVSEDQAQLWMSQLVEGVAWFHSLLICHRDLKLENVLLTAGGDVKIADFGMSKDYSLSNAHTRTRIGTLAYIAPEMLQAGGAAVAAAAAPAGGGGGGAAAAAAAAPLPYEPEPVDIWAAGVLLYVMTCGRYPFGTDQAWNAARQEWVTSNENRVACMRRIELGQFDRSGQFLQLSPPLQHLISRCLDPDPATRATLDSLRVDPWMAGGGGGGGGGGHVREPRDWDALWPAMEDLESALSEGAFPRTMSSDSRDDDAIFGSPAGSATSMFEHDEDEFVLGDPLNSTSGRPLHASHDSDM
eukprot:SAG22_NODE_81_length_21778_cov_38.345173_13_plen_419_part_00